MEAPESALTPTLIERLRANKADLIALLNDSGRYLATPITPVSREQPLPLSFAQQRLWFLDQLIPNSSQYNMSGGLRLRGRLDRTALDRTFQQLAQRHEALRTHFENIDGQPWQVIETAWEQPLLAYEDLQTMPATEREVEVLRRAQQEAARPFDLSRGPLLRVHLWQLSDEEHVLLLNMHHIVSDGWSMGVLIRELSLLYRAFCNGDADPLPPLSVQYADYAVWQRGWLSEEVLEQQLSYWREQLAGAEVLELLTDHPRPAVSTGRGASVDVQLPQHLSESLKKLCLDQGVSLFMLILSAWQVLLSRYTGQEDIVVGAPIAIRTQRQTEGLIGFFVNTLALRNDLSGDPRFVELLEQVRQRTLSAYAHQDLPFEQLVDALELERDLSRESLVQVMFAWQNTPTAELELGELSLQPLLLEQTTTLFDLTLMMGESEAGLLGSLAYRSDLFERETIERMAGHLETLLEGIVSAPECRLSEFSLLTDSERQQLLVEWNDTAADFPGDPCIHELFEAQVWQTPEAVAAVFGDQELTFAQLNARANQLAHHLRDLGVGPEVLVGICHERSLEMVVGLLGILKAGGAYVPLDPDYPAERLAFMLEDTQAPVLLTQQALLERLPAHHAQVLCLDADWDQIKHQPDTNLPAQASPQHLAYVIYTSGSTGNPKGVLLQHHGAINLAFAEKEFLALGHTSSVLQFASLNFDASVWEIFATLLSGARLCLATRDDLMPGVALAKTVDRHAVTHLTLPPSALQAMAPDSLKTCEVLVVAGEDCPVELVRQWCQGRTMYNAYGPTEVTVCATISEPLDEACRLNIGKPIANTQVYLLDRAGNLVPQGVIGELFVASAGLARGYWNQPELTAERFIANPFADDPNSRLYKTGDLCRWLPDGNLEFLGRSDHQVKVRGHRIELGEIEAALSSHDQVREVAVMAQEDLTGEKRLVAYVVPPADRSTVSATTLREHLRAALPLYMVPGAFVFLESLPLTPNGKLDRKALPAPDGHLELDEQYVPPRNPVEEQLCNIWQEVLRLDRVGVQDNFFHLGGDSILSIQVVARAAQKGLRLTVRQMFEHQTIATLAEGARRQVELQAEQGLAHGEVQLTPIQHWFFEQELPDAHHWNQAVLLMPTRPLCADTLQQAAEQLLQQHDALRLRFHRQAGGSWRQYFAAPEDLFVVEQVGLSQVDASQQASELEQHAAQKQASLDFEEGPLWRMTLFDLGAAPTSHGSEQPRQRLLIAIHHLAIDMVSWRILLEDLGHLYEQISAGEPLSLPAKTTSLQQWAERLLQYAQSDDLLAELDYWQGVVETGPMSPPQALPIDDPQGDNTVGSAETMSVTLTAEQTETLLREVPAAYQTQINDVLLTALLQAYAAWSGQDSLVLNLEGHGREELFADLDLSRTVGWFTTIYPLRLASPNTASPEVSLKAVKEQLRAVPQRGIGYGLLRYLSDHPQADALRAAPDAALSFNYFGQFDTAGAEGLLDMAGESPGPSQSPSGQRHHLIDVSGVVSGGQLRMDWTYSTQLHQRSTVTALAEHFQAKLLALIEHCVSAEAGGYTPSDFPLSGLEQRQLDRLIHPEQARTQAIEDIYPLSGMQQGMVYHTLREPDSGVYYEQLVFELEGSLDVEAFAQAWQRVQSRHSALRSTFLWQGVSQMLQVVHRRQVLPFGCRDWRERDAEQQRQDLDVYMASCRSAGFDLEAGPLWSVELIRHSETCWWCMFCAHHALWDGWSLPVILQEVLQGYQTAIVGQPPSLPPARPYRDYIAWLGRQDHEAAEAFWREQLCGVSAATPLGVERVSRGVEPGPEEVDLPLDAALSDRLRQFARRQRLTLNTLLQGAWALLLSRYSGQEDVIFGATTSGRPAELAGVERMVGLFINTLPVRVRTAGNDRVEDWLSQLQERQLAARQFEHCSLVDLQSWSEVPAGSPLFESLLVFENYPVSDELRSSHWGELRVAGVKAREQTNYPLTVAVIPGTEFGLKFYYDHSRFEHETIQRLAGHLQRLLEGIVTSPECRLSQLPLLNDGERQQVLVEWNEPAADYPRDLCIHQLFETQAARTPEAAAVVFEDQELTYAQLNARANQLARHLRQLGAGPEVLVGICVERSLEMVVGLLGILKAGAAYVPLDPDYPAERLAFMLEDSHASVLLTQQALLERLPASDAEVFCLDTDWQQIEQLPADNPPPQANAENLAYVIYTSGSTGKPKGSLITHACVMRLLTGTEAWFEFNEKDVWTLFHSFAFDFSVWEIWGSLTYGGRLVVVPYWVTRTPEAFYQLLVKEGVTVLNQTPSAFWQLAQVDEGAALRLRYVIFGGEALAVDRLRPWFERHGDQSPQLVNMYGITETTVHVTYRPLRQHDTVAQVGSPIGISIGDLQLYVLDRHQYPTPIGVAGELHVGGAGLARGYLDRPELTAERFVPDPFCESPGCRLYKTGDLCRWLPDGSLEFLGRLDQQVKIRGYRIELGEIESALLAHDQVREVAVLAREDKPGEKRLVAYVAPSDDTAILAATLREHLEACLPSYMVPSAFVFLTSLPLTANGKLDRKALPAPEGHQTLEEQYVPPRNPVEEQLCGIWQEVLHVDQVGVQDNFFHFGGHSLLATQVISRVRAAFQVELPVAALFTGPTVAELAQALQQQWTTGAAEVSVPPLATQQRDEVVPLSFAQQRLWFLDQLLPDSPQYNMPGALRLRGHLDRTALERAFQQLVQRHEALRTRFESIDGHPRQVIETTWGQPLLAYEDLRPLSAAERETEVLRRAQLEASQPFDLSCGPLLRVCLWQVSDEEHVLLLNMHHIVSDGWSMGVLVRELSVLYGAFCDEQSDPLPPLSVQYADYAIWQRGWLSEEILEHQLSYWREQLEGAEVLELATDHPRPAVSAGQGGSVDVQLPKSLSEGLKQLCLEQEVSLFMLLLSAWQVLLSRYSGQDDIVVGAPIANRTQRQTEGLIGIFVNTLALRSNLSGDPQFSELLGQVRQRMLAAYAHQDLPFEQLVDALLLERDLSRESLVQVMFAWQNAPPAELELGELRWEPLPLKHTTAKFDLTLSLGESEAGLSGALEYRSDLFEHETIQRMVSHLQRLLEGIVSAPQSRLSQLPLLTDDERQQVLVDWNDTAAEYPADQCIHDLFEAQVQQTPEAVAAVFESQQLTYAQLNARANQLAHHLRQIGVGPEVLVGICVERSLEMLVGLMGILKAGGAYVPLDPDYPTERLAFMLEDTQAPVLLTQHALLERLPAHGAHVLCLDADWNQVEQQTGVNLPAHSNADNLAYVIYTSGSTGRPKGAMINHRNVLNYLLWAREAYNVSAGCGAPVNSSLGFDATITSLLTPLVAGRRVTLLPQEDEIDHLAAVLQSEEDFSLVKITPSHLDVLQQLLPRGKSAGRTRAYVIGGEALTDSHLQFWRDLNPNVHLINEYGPTETVVGCCVYDIPVEKEIPENVPIGRAIANTQLYVLDPDHQPIPVGVAGELYIGGAGLARGYLSRPELTAERFIPNPFSEAPGSRLYRTGDLCRWLPDGNLEFLGRLDHQVKIRGYRIELGEIESALLSHGQVREAVALAREDQPGDKRLVAYVAPADDTNVSAATLRDHLQAALPPYMVPAAFVFLDALPLTPNGKLDRKALPTPDEHLELEGQYVPPRNPVEEQLCGIWQEVLRVERVGVQDNFFHLGGHSLLATQVVSRVRGSFQVELPVAALFTGPTVAELAQSLEKQWSAGAAGGGVPALVPQQRDEVVPLSFAQQRLWFLDQLLPDSPQYNMPGGLRLRGPLDRTALEQAFQQVVQRHESLRTRFENIDGQPRQVIESEWSQPLLTYEDLRPLSEEEREGELLRRAQQEASRPFDLSRGPLLRVCLWQVSDEEHVLLLNMHHIVSDGWSTGVLTGELSALYAAFTQGKPEPLPPLSVQYADYAIWQRGWLSGDVLEGQLRYWREQLAGAEMLELLTDHPRPAVSAGRGGSIDVELTKSLSEGLKQLCLEQEVSLFMLLLAAWQVFLSRYTGQEDIVVGVPIANRTRRQTEGLIGFFVNTLALRNDLSGDPQFSELLGEVRQRTLAAYAHQDLPFEQLVDDLQLERDLSRESLVQVMFAWQNVPPAELELGELSWEPLPLQHTTAKLDLTLALSESEAGLSGALEYRSDLFKRETIERMASQLQRLLEGIAAAPESRLSQLPLLADDERQQLLVEWNDTEMDYPREQCIHQLFETRATGTPEATAVVFEDQQLTYTELNARANQLAHHLRELGVGPEVLVGICVERSLEMVVGLLGILKAGGAYMPLDPDYPAERLAFMLEDSQAPVLLTQQALLEQLPARHAHVVHLDADWNQIQQQPDVNPPALAHAENLAYIIYTSGSTGRPKGVQISQRALVNFLCSMRDRPGLASSDRLQAVTTLSFDISGLELFLPLIQGAQLRLTSQQSTSDPGELARLLADNTNLMQATPATWQMLMESGWAGNRDLVALCGGEAMPRRLADWLMTRVKCAWNMYGPTETTIWSSIYRLEPGNGPVSIGCPIANTEVYILDGTLTPVPVGVAGELYIGGAGLSRGYLNRPELTAEKFVPNPFSRAPGSRLYRTGDLCRWLPDGSLEFLRRLDHQVKVRGYRIELGEIESVLASHAAVRESVVIAREDTPGENRLVGYLVADVGQLEDGDDLRDERVAVWRTVWDNAYEKAEGRESDGFDISGWASSYTGEPIPADQMQAWRDHTVARIVSTEPARVWEMGCGTGLLLFGVAPHCSHYYGTDISKVALNALRAEVETRELKHVVLQHRPADDFTGLPPEPFDLVVINSVAQYFPELDYLKQVLKGAVESVTDGGTVLVGDVRSQPLLEAFHTSVQLYQTSDDLPIEQFRKQVRWKLEREEELTLDPEFFRSLCQDLPRLSHADVLLKRGSDDNEMTRYRYDVLLHVGEHFENVEVSSTLDWSKGVADLEALERLLSTGPEALEVLGIRNTRVFADQLAAQDLADVQGRVGDLRKRLANDSTTIEPEVLWELGERLGYVVRVTWSRDHGAGSMDVLFERRSDAERRRCWVPGRRPLGGSSPSLGNNPLQVGQTQRLAPALREHLQASLPPYMLPSAFVFLDSFPLTPNGKLDRKALPAPDGRLELEGQYISPRNLTEEQLCGIWQEVLHLDRVGVQDNFFHLGGHSLLAVQVMARVQTDFEKNLPLAVFFQNPTVEKLAEVVHEDSPVDLWNPLVSIQSQGGEPPIFFVPGAGGNVFYLNDIARHLGHGRPFYGLQPPGLDGQTIPLASVEELAAHFVEAIQAAHPNGPYYLAGHSHGGKVAFELAQQLQRKGHVVGLLAIVDTDAPTKHWDEVQAMKNVDQMEAMLDEAARLGMLPPSADDRQVQIRGMLQVYKSNMMSGYECPPDQAVPTRIVLFRPAESRPQDGNGQELSDPCLGWSHYADGPVELLETPGNHITMMGEPHVQYLAERLRALLDNADNSESKTTFISESLP